MVGKCPTPELYPQSFHRFIFVLKIRVLPSCQADLKFMVAQTLLPQILSLHHQSVLKVNFEARLRSRHVSQAPRCDVLRPGDTRSLTGPGGRVTASADWPGRAGPAPEARRPMSAPRTGWRARGPQPSFSDAAACAAVSAGNDVRRAALLRAMSRRESAANASSSGVAPRRSSAGSRGAGRTAAEEQNRRGRVGSSRGAGGGWREPAGATAEAAVAGGRREPPLCFGVKNDVVGAVIGERGRATAGVARGAVLGRPAGSAGENLLGDSRGVRGEAGC